VFVRDGDYFGAPVNLAARLLSLTGPGEVGRRRAARHPARLRALAGRAEAGAAGEGRLVIPQVVERA
jgi:class 3 adenylate cyclase